MDWAKRPNDDQPVVVDLNRIHEFYDGIENKGFDVDISEPFDSLSQTSDLDNSIHSTCDEGNV